MTPTASPPRRTSSGALRARLGTPVPAAEAPDRDAALAQLARKLSPSASSAALSEGRGRELEGVIDLAVEAIDRLDDGGAPGGRLAGPLLTPRELAVLALLAAGHTNREIAEALYISASTAGVHVSNMLRKLGAKRRVDAAGIAHRTGLLPIR